MGQDRKRQLVNVTFWKTLLGNDIRLSFLPQHGNKPIALDHTPARSGRLSLHGCLVAIAASSEPVPRQTVKLVKPSRLAPAGLASSERGSPETDPRIDQRARRRQSSSALFRNNLCGAGHLQAAGCQRRGAKEVEDRRCKCGHRQGTSEPQRSQARVPKDAKVKVIRLCGVPVRFRKTWER